MKTFGKAISIAMLIIMITITAVSAAVNSVTPSTNEINKNNGWAHVDVVDTGIGNVTLNLVNPRAFYSCFEYRTDGNISQKISNSNYNSGVTDGLYPYYCVNNNTRPLTLQANEYVEVRMVFGAETDERFDWTRFNVIPDTRIKPVVPAEITCTDGTKTVDIVLPKVTGLYGYEFKVTYDQTKVDATARFVDTWFDTTTDANKAWNAECAAGVCKFAVTKLNPTLPLTGGGTVAQITFDPIGTAAMVVDLAVVDSKLSDINGAPIDHTEGSASFPICAYAEITGTVALQGRATPGDAGTVTFTNTDDGFAPVTVNFNAAGAYTATVKYMLGGSKYDVKADHSLYLFNVLPALDVTMTTVGPLATTKLKAGDATNDEIINVGDLTCIGANFGSAAVPCGTGSSDINADGATNIFDLSLAGGNYSLVSPQPW